MEAFSGFEVMGEDDFIEFRLRECMKICFPGEVSSQTSI